MSELTVIQARVQQLEADARAAFESALEAFKAELVRLGIEHEVTPAAPAVVVDPSPVRVSPDTGGSPTNTKPK